MSLEIDDLSPILANPEVAKVLADLFKDASQPAMKKIGTAFSLIVDTAFVLPLRLWHARRYAEATPILKRYIDMIEGIAEEQVCPIPPEIGIPVLEKLTYVRDEDISSLFVNLLAKASSTETLNLAHPRFVEMIGSLSSDEARILVEVAHRPVIKYLVLEGDHVTESWMPLKSPLTGLEHRCQLTFPDNIGLYMDNLISLGILKREESLAARGDRHAELFKLYEPLRLTVDTELDRTQFSRTDFVAGRFRLTEYGRMFIKACTSQSDS
ncbi:MAG: DUF4393 domain-containing protein [Desulfomonilaceae bacterium]